MEVARGYLSRYPSRFAAYVALQVALMRRYTSRGGTVEEFCASLAPVYRRRYGPLFFGREEEG